MNARSSTPRGFGLLEAIVALTILASAGLALFAWINQNLQSATRVRQAELQSRLTLTAEALVEGLNPLTQPEGLQELAGVNVRWTSHEVAPVHSNTAAVEGRPGDWEVGLYRVDVEAEDTQHGVTTRFSMLRAGYRRVRAGPGPT
jgi:general secretion pathway protein I